VVLGVALSDMLDQRAVVGEEIRRDVNGLRVPDLAVFQAEFLGTQSGQEAEFGANAEVGHDNIESFVQELVFADFAHQVVTNALLSRHRALDAMLQQA